MEKKNVVSIWIGEFNSKEELLKYSQEIYPDGSDEPVCAFWEDFNIDYIDHDNLEMGFKEKVMSFEDLFKWISYSQSFINEIKNNHKKIDILKFNSVICVYDFEYEKFVENKEDVFFIGNFSYDKKASAVI